MADKYDCLKLENQLCFPLYACAKEVVRHYKPFLDKLDLTYTQYIVMMVLWEKKSVNVKTLGENLYLDSGTLRKSMHCIHCFIRLWMASKRRSHRKRYV